MKLISVLFIVIVLYANIALSANSTFCVPYYASLEEVDGLELGGLEPLALSAKIGLRTENACEAAAIRCTANAKKGIYPWFDPIGERFDAMKNKKK